MSKIDLTKKKVAVIGSREFENKKRLYEVLTKNKDKIKLIISGGARGADSLATEWAADYGIPYLVFPAMWHDPETGEYNKGAGFKRNRSIVEQCDILFAFWDGKSKGTQHSLEMAKQLNKPVRIISFASQDEPQDASQDTPKVETVTPPTDKSNVSDTTQDEDRLRAVQEEFSIHRSAPKTSQPEEEDLNVL